MKNNEPSIQEFGSLSTKEGRLLAFPNVLQHRVSPFELTDPSKPGHRKILALFLVDPKIQVISTANVPPQQKSWWEEYVISKAKPITNMPPEIYQQTLAHVDFPYTLKEATAIMEEVIEERKADVAQVNELYQSHLVSYCEH